MFVKVKSSRLKEEENNKYIEFTLDQLGLETSEWPPESLRIILNRFPTLLKHDCIYPNNGGFLKVIIEGTTFAHVAQHLAMILQQIELNTHESIKLSDTNEVVVTIPCLDYEEGVEAFKYSLKLLENIIKRYL
jgi:hypothetical protein